MVNVRRSEFEIISDILTLSRNGAKKTELIYQGNLSYTQVQKYLPFLIERQILEVAKLKGGRITVSEVAMNTSLSLSEAEKQLKELASKG